MKAYVIKNRDGYYLVSTKCWNKNIQNACMFESEEGLDFLLSQQDCEDCEITEIEIIEKA